MTHSLKKLIDTTLGSPACMLLGLATSKKKFVGTPKRILLVKLWAIGDSITMLPLAAALRTQYPGARIDVLCRYQNADVFRASALFDEVLFFEPLEIGDLSRRCRAYDLVFDGEPFLRLSALISYFMGSYRVGFDHDIRRRVYNASVNHDRSRHMVENYLSMARALGLIVRSPKVLCALTVSPLDQSVAAGLLAQHGVKGNDVVIALAPAVGAEGRTRLWNQNNWAGLADTLTKKYSCRIVFLGTSSDRSYIEQIRKTMKTASISLAGETTLLQSVALLDRAHLVISLDAGLMHLSSAQGRPIIGLFGPNVPSLWAPYGPSGRAVYHPISCSPCIENRRGFIPDCLRTTDRYLCMRLITTVEVLRVVGELYGTHVKRTTHPITHRREHQDKTRSPRKTRSRNR